MVIKEIFRLFSLITIVYIIRFVDNYYLLWQSYALDYSTHTAFSLAMVFFFLSYNFKLKMGVIFSFVIYLTLMVYQKYHTIVDILTTIAILFPVMVVMNVYFDSRVSVKNKLDAGGK